MELLGIDIAKLASGNNTEFEKLYTTYFPVFLYFANDFINSEDVSRDIVQDIFMKYWKNHESFNDIISLKVFIYRSIRNSCLNELRKVRTDGMDIPELQYLASDEFLQENIIDKEISIILRQQIMRMPESRRRILILSLEGKNNREIAEILDISPNTVKTHKQKAYSELRVWVRHLHILLNTINII